MLDNRSQATFIQRIVASENQQEIAVIWQHLADSVAEGEDIPFILNVIV